uniref:Kazal-like domain-containing protein n=1 Tax=uncultured Thiotrichaceae bacterium TaxID=298394 RepID=A0A6S6T752_9GAMM|nr:MAG: Unknown protein [uncultured Thiotrichaceae bacterium]
MKRSILSIITLLAIALLFSACRSTPTPSPAPNVGGHSASGNQTQCEEPRSKMCTREYRPVCGTTLYSPPCPAGMVCTAVMKMKKVTYSNACTACSNENVQSHAPGACPK